MNGRLPRLIWIFLKSWSLTSQRFPYKWALSLFGGSSRGAGMPTMHRDTWGYEGIRDGHTYGAGGEMGHPPSQPDQPNQP